MLTSSCVRGVRCVRTGTGAEIWDQTNGRVDGVVMGAGTGGTLAGITKYLKARTQSHAHGAFGDD